MIDETLESAAGDLAEVREWLEAAREALRRAVDAQDGNPEALIRVVNRLKRIEAEVARVERDLAGRVTTVNV